MTERELFAKLSGVDELQCHLIGLRQIGRPPPAATEATFRFACIRAPAVIMILATFLVLATACSIQKSTPTTPLATWWPAETPSAVIVALHGFNDYKGSFAEFGRYASQRGVAVEAYDQPGFGERTDRGRWQGVGRIVSELHRTIGALRSRHPDTPIYVLGESMGAAVAMTALARSDSSKIAGLILVAPAVRNGESLPKFYRTTLHILANLVPQLLVDGRNLGYRASDNIEALQALGRDPLYVHETRLDAVAGLVELMVKAQAEAPKLKLPILVLLGARDQIVPPQASRRFMYTLDRNYCTTATYLDGWHLLLRDRQRERVFADIVAWVLGQPLPSRLDHACAPAPNS